MITNKWKVDPVTGELVSPTGDELDITAQSTLAGDTLMVNQNAGSGRPTGLAIAAQSLVLRLAGRIQSFAMATNTVLVRGGSDIYALALGAQSVMIRAAGNIIAAAIGTDQVLGRQGSGDLGGVKVTPDMTAPIMRSFTVTGTNVAASTNLTLTADQTTGTWAAVSGNTQVVPEAGLYKAELHYDAQCSNATSGIVVSVNLLVNGVISGRLGRGVRYDAVVGNVFPHPGGPYLFRITTPASQALSLQVDTGNTTVNVGRLTITKVAP